MIYHLVVFKTFSTDWQGDEFNESFRIFTEDEFLEFFEDWKAYRKLHPENIWEFRRELISESQYDFLANIFGTTFGDFPDFSIIQKD